MKYTPIQTKDGKIQHVPIVVKNRDVFVGYIRAYNDILNALNEMEVVDLSDETILAELAPSIDSSRFNNYIDDDVDASKLSDEQLEEMKSNEMAKLNQQGMHPEIKDDILEVGFFSIDCNCGNFVSFKTVKEIPHDDFRCDICDRTLIQYIHVEDEDIEFDGEK